MSSSKNNESTEHVNPQRQGTSSSGASTSGEDGPSNKKGSALTFDVGPASHIEGHSIPSLVSPPAQPVPSRVASLTAKFHRVNRYLHLPLFATGYNYGQAVAFSVYAFFICFGCFYKTFTPAFGPKRAGFIATGQYPIIFALGAKNNVVGFMLGVGYEKLNAWHRWVGKMMFVSSMAHVVGYLVRWTAAGRLVSGSQRQPHGWAAFAGLCLLSVISIPPIRKYSYGMFWHAHWMGYVMMIVGMVWHADDGWKWSVAASVIIIFDQICRLFKTSFTYATITAVPELGCTRVEVPHLTRGWRAGQHVRLRTVSTVMGAFDALEAHPMTIATVSESSGREGVVLYVKKAGDWSNRLYEAAKGPEKGEISEKGIESEGEKSTKMRMIIEGPYGGPGHDVLSSFSSAFIVAGGSGITFGLSSVDEIIREAEKGLAKTKLIEFIWVIQDPASLLHMMLVLQTFVNRVARLPTLDIKIDVFYTRAMSGNIPETLNNGFNLPANVTLSPGRPKFDAMLDHFVDRTRQLPEGPEGLHGTVVGCCGPESLCHSVKRAELSIKGRKRDAVGGIEVVEE
ncbi:hypothetical protein M407DRAFT_212299 [Tulasnella calospora MUT 4182]|uniref:ferric-chelate reductase (NADPH) n=1 Tax=Tulasnella calospora MUT 4182 TaxID=1051891 RepID=A0A0C3Q5Z5_9AGAM|nr:hypothetical protein M407DRAFT_212299 [Tulasnella calospora MUT 4182]